MRTLETKCITTLRMLSVDAIEKANSGHPGLPLGCAALAHTLWANFLKHNPQNPNWLNRDRFVLSAGHGSALLYSLLHLYGYDLSLEEIQNFRQWGSKTPGHPEYGETPGVEATTGPLGQGFAMGVGMAMAERFLSELYNKPNYNVIDHHVYGIVSDGDLMEGVTAEAASLAGHLQLGKLIYLYDDNKISIDGNTDITFSENVSKRFLAYNWHVSYVEDGNNCQAIANAIELAQKETKPSLIVVKTHIGFGSPKQDTAAAHGSPLGQEALSATKEKFNWPHPSFHIPQDVKEEMQKYKEKGIQQEKIWLETWNSYKREFPEKAKQLQDSLDNDINLSQDKEICSLFDDISSMATRSASEKVINKIAEKIPYFLGGSADLAGSNKTDIKSSHDFGQTQGRNIRFGIREHAMGSIVNGMNLHKGVISFAATFLVFSDYMRPAIRLAALMKTPSIFIFTHDSIALGEDGPTHQPVEHLMSLRMIPNLVVMRPADAIETAEMWKEAVSSKLPVVLSLTRQNLPVMNHYKENIVENAKKGAYVLDADDVPQVIIIATGSEVSLALEAQKSLREQNVKVTVVSMPSWELFQQQDNAYKNEVLPTGVPKIAIEAGSSFGWEKYVTKSENIIGIDRFGASAPWQIVYKEYGFSAENVTNIAKAAIKNA